MPAGKRQAALLIFLRIVGSQTRRTKKQITTQGKKLGRTEAMPSGTSRARYQKLAAAGAHPVSLIFQKIPEKGVRGNSHRLRVYEISPGAEQVRAEERWAMLGTPTSNRNFHAELFNRPRG